MEIMPTLVVSFTYDYDEDDIAFAGMDEDDVAKLTYDQIDAGELSLDELLDAADELTVAVKEDG
jgi:hypothetical protein